MDTHGSKLQKDSPGPNLQPFCDLGVGKSQRSTIFSHVLLTSPSPAPFFLLFVPFLGLFLCCTLSCDFSSYLVSSFLISPRCVQRLARKNNDDPMLDYGAAVAIKFASKRNAVRDMTPKDYGAFLRNDPEQGLLIDNFSCRPAERGKVRATYNVFIESHRPRNIHQFVHLRRSREGRFHRSENFVMPTR